MLRISAAVSVGASICLVLLAAELRSDEPAVAKVARPEQRLRFVQLFHVGQFVSFSARNTSTGYALSLYTPAERKQAQARYEADLLAYEKYQRNRQLVAAKQRELRQELKTAEPAERNRIMAELRGIGVEPGAGNPLAAGDRGLFGAARQRPRRPSVVRFYTISEIGENYICLMRDRRQLYIPVWSIRSASRNAEDEVRAPHTAPDLRSR